LNVWPAVKADYKFIFVHPSESSILKNKFIAISQIIAAIIGLSACGNNDKTAPPKTAMAGTPASVLPIDPTIIKPDAALLTRIKVANIEEHNVVETLRVAGRLETNLYKTMRVGAPIPGRLTHIDARFSQEVKAGQVLAEISSPELAQAQLSFLKAHSQLKLMTQAVERAELLLSADVIGSAELQRRQAEKQIAGAEKRAVSDQLKALGISTAKIATLEATGQIQSSASITASGNGTVIDVKVTRGQVISPTDVLFVISDLSELWALAELPEQDSQFVKTGQRVQVEIPALGQVAIVGTVAYVADIVNPETRTVRVGVSLPNRERKLKPSMLMTMLIEGKPISKAVVPLAAVVRENDADHIFVKQADGAFKLTRIELGPESQGQRPLLNSLRGAPKDTQIVIDGAFHLNNVRSQRAVSG
jgi:membrane fusion protein, heavy metal efflux system